MSPLAETPKSDSTVIRFAPGRAKLTQALEECLAQSSTVQEWKKCLAEHNVDVPEWIENDLRAHFEGKWKKEQKFHKPLSDYHDLLSHHKAEVKKLYCECRQAAEANCTTLARFTKQTPAGAGNFGEVLQAFDTKLERIVALKLSHWHDGITSDNHLEEARTACRLKGTEFVTVYEPLTTATGRLCVVMEWVDAPTLHKALIDQSGPWDIRRVCRIMISLLDALAKIHTEGIVHNDLKPANLFLNNDDTIRISDFGGATKINLSGGQHTDIYSAPEVFKNEPNTIKTDIYSAACIAFELLTGQRCFTSKTHTGKYDWPEDLRAKRPKVLVDAVDAGLKFHPNDRTRSATEFADQFRAFRDSLPKAPTADDHHLGAAPSHVCHGRDDFIRDEVDAIQRNLGSPNRARLYHGPGGIGKSTVAHEIARHKEIAAQFGPERYYAKLDGVTSADGVAGAVADAFQLTGADRLQTLDFRLSANVNRLILLDTVDDPISEAQANVVPLLQKWGGYSHITLLLTSRPGRVPRGEWITDHRIDPMPHAGLAAIFHEQNAQQFSKDASLDAVLSLAGGMPLAAKLLGAFANDCESLQEVLDAFAKKGATILHQNELDRSLSVRVTVAMSLDRKRIRESEPAQRLLRLLAELPDGCLASELPEILPDDSDEAQQVLRNIGGLAEEIDGRWTMLAPIREELRKKLERNTDDWHRTIRYYAITIEQMSFAYRDRGDRDALVRFQDNQRNLVMLLEEGLSLQIGECIEGVEGMARFGERLGIDYRELLKRAVVLAGTLKKDLDVGVCWGMIADILQQRGEIDEALRIRREEQLPVFERLGDVRSKAVTMGQIADILQQRGEIDEALRIRREEELPVYERLGDVHSKAVTMGQIADIFQKRGETDEALRIRRDECIPVFERLGDVREKAVTMGKIADILQQRGQTDEALRIRLEEELPVYERIGDVRSLLITRAQIGMALLLKPSPTEADIKQSCEHLLWALATAEKHQYAEAAQLREIVTQWFGGSV